MIPELTEDGLLPPGVHSATWDEIMETFGTTPHRRRLMAGLQMASRSLAAAGCQTIYLDGSFVTDEPAPKDFDACWDIQGVDAGKLDPVLLDFRNRCAAQKAKYGGEFFPAQGLARLTPMNVFLEFFQRTRDGDPKGIIAIELTQRKK